MAKLEVCELIIGVIGIVLIVKISKTISLKLPNAPLIDTKRVCVSVL